MRITPASRFAHPVLGNDSGDFASGEFDISLVVEEKLSSGALTIEHEVTLTEPSVLKLVESGVAIIGMFVRCDDTYYRELRRVAWPKGSIDFPLGALLNRVTIRPLIWLEGDLPDWNPDGIHPEFEPPVSLAKADVIAVGNEYVISVGQAKLATLESIFELKRSDDVADGIRIDPEQDRVCILAGQNIFDTISLLREQQAGLGALLNGVYLPAVMEILEMVRSDSSAYTDRRWFQAFMAKCDSKGIDLSGQQSLLEMAQLLLDYPTKQLTQMLVNAGVEE